MALMLGDRCFGRLGRLCSVASNDERMLQRGQIDNYCVNWHFGCVCWNNLYPVVPSIWSIDPWAGLTQYRTHIQDHHKPERGSFRPLHVQIITDYLLLELWPNSVKITATFQHRMAAGDQSFVDIQISIPINAASVTTTT